MVHPMPDGTPGSEYRRKSSFWSLGYHTGTDLLAPEGTSIFSMTDGVVVESAFPTSWGDSYGNAVIVDDGACHHLYAHMSSRSVKAGERVRAGQKLGQCGSTGKSTAPHLHVESRRNTNLAFGADIDPTPFFTTKEADDMPEQRYLSKSRGETVKAGKEACIDWEKKSWGDGPGTSITLPGAATVQVTASIGLSARPDWMRISVWEKQGETYVRTGGLGATQDVPDMGAAVYTIQSHGRVPTGRMLRLEVGAGDRDITVWDGSGLLSALVWS